MAMVPVWLVVVVVVVACVAAVVALQTSCPKCRKWVFPVGEVRYLGGFTPEQLATATGARDVDSLLSIPTVGVEGLEKLKRVDRSAFGSGPVLAVTVSRCEACRDTHVGRIEAHEWDAQSSSLARRTGTLASGVELTPAHMERLRKLCQVLPESAFRRCPHPSTDFEFDYSPDFHDKFSIHRCRQCGVHLKLSSFESVDWDKGKDRSWSASHELTPDEYENEKSRAASFKD